MTEPELVQAHDLVRSGANRITVMRQTKLTYDQVCELFERCGRNKLGPVYPPDVCKKALQQLMGATA